MRQAPASNRPFLERMSVFWKAVKSQIPGTVEHKEVHDYKMHTGDIGSSRLAKLKAHLPGTVEFKVRHPASCGLEVSATGALGPGADPSAGPCTGNPRFRTGVGYGGHPAGGAAAGYPAPCYTRQGWR
ncbi:hypothetical protein CVIRNUC_010397 [Coccomyxa viridis]|uniref:Uncharacterized protein n=1 Tax=Coccomyxa viridis TaxID=1274662 RepID=A0AAV1IK25_9CHLO|nr:hypothetical protein CVIRNUC_010397 [Coccomyxa viridis]